MDMLIKEQNSYAKKPRSPDTHFHAPTSRLYHRHSWSPMDNSFLQVNLNPFGTNMKNFWQANFHFPCPSQIRCKKCQVTKKTFKK